MYGSLPPQQVSDASQRHISRLCLQKEHFTIMALSPIKVWVCISERMISDFNETWCIWSRRSCKIYYESDVSTEVCKQNTVKTKGQREWENSVSCWQYFCLCAIFGISSILFYLMVNVKLWHVLWHYSDHVHEPNLKNKDNENKAGAASLYFTKKTECYGNLWHTKKSLYTNILLFL